MDGYNDDTVLRYPSPMQHPIAHTMACRVWDGYSLGVMLPTVSRRSTNTTDLNREVPYFWYGIQGPPVWPCEMLTAYHDLAAR